MDEIRLLRGSLDWDWIDDTTNEEEKIQILRLFDSLKKLNEKLAVARQHQNELMTQGVATVTQNYLALFRGADVVDEASMHQQPSNAYGVRNKRRRTNRLVGASSADSCDEEDWG
jgi:hypothetical protein